MPEPDLSMPHLDAEGKVTHGTNAVTIDPASYVRLSREQMRANVPQSVKDRQELARLKQHLTYANIVEGLRPDHEPHQKRLKELVVKNGGNPILPAQTIRDRIAAIEMRLKKWAEFKAAKK